MSCFPVDRHGDDGTVRRRKRQCRACIQAVRRRAEARRKETRRKAVDFEAAGRVPVGPVRGWMADYMETWKLSVEEMAVRMGIPARTVRAWLREREFVGVDLLDEALCHFGEPFLLGELYPELFEEAVVELEDEVEDESIEDRATALSRAILQHRETVTNRKTPTEKWVLAEETLWAAHDRIMAS